MPLPLAAGVVPGVVPRDVDLADVLETATEAARAAGAFLSDRAAARAEFRGKGDEGDLVSELDLGAEALILDRLCKRYPEFPVFAEESGLRGARDESWMWFVDPLDGTHNLAIGLSAYVVGVTLCYRGQPMVGVVHEPETRRTWSAVVGEGAIAPDGSPLVPLPGRREGRAVVAWTQGYRVERTDARVNSLKLMLEREAHRVLPLWAPLLGWTMLARGDIDGFVGYRPELVDLPGGMLLAREAGVEIRAYDGTSFGVPFDPAAPPHVDRSFIAARAERLPMLIDLVARADALAPRLAGVVDP